MSEWLSVIPQILFTVALFTVPGLVAALCLRFRWWDAVALSAPLSFGISALANLVSSYGSIRWGLPVLAATAVCVAVLCAGWSLAQYWRSRGQSATDVVTRILDGVVWGRHQHVLAVAATVGAVVVGVIAIARGIGTPGTLNQSLDGAFHVSAIDAISHRRLASPSFVAHIGDPGGTGGFYPPTFAASAALSVIYTGLSPIAAANVAAVAMVAVWPLTMSMAVRRIARPTAFGYAVAMIGAVTVGLYPALLLTWGTLWPNAMSVLTLGPGLVLLMRLTGADSAQDGLDDPHSRLGWWQCLLAMGIVLVGMVYVQPNAVFVMVYLGMPLLVWVGWRRFVRPTVSRRAKIRLGIASVAGAIGLVSAVIAVTNLNASIAAVARFRWAAREDWWSALRQVLILTSRQSHPNLAFALLVLIGVVGAWRYARGRYLIICFVILVSLCTVAAGVQSGFTRFFTGYWYNDPFRIYALVPVIALPIAATGADVARSWMRTLLDRRAARNNASSRRWSPASTSVATAVVCVAIVALQGGLGTARISRTVVTNYSSSKNSLVSPGQAALFKRLASEVPAGMTIAGSPYTGEVLAGAVSGRTAVYPLFGAPLDPVRALVARDFAEYQSDPAVCEAVKSLRIGVVVTRESPLSTLLYYPAFAGFNNMDLIPGLTKIDSGGGAVAYRVGPCQAYRYPLGFDVSPAQNVMFASLTKLVPVGTVIAGSPYQGEILAGALSGSPTVYTDFTRPTERLQALVAAKFSELQTNREVCAAVKRLNIGVVVTGAGTANPPKWASRAYGGFVNLSSVPGLTVIAKGGGATAYSVGDCKLPRTHHKKLSN